MAWPEKRKRADGTVFFRIRDRDGNGRKIVVIDDAGPWREAAQKKADEIDAQKKLDPSSIGEDRPISDALAKWLNSQPFSSQTKYKYRVAIESFAAYAKVNHVRQLERAADDINAWRAAMESGKCRWTRNQGKTWHPYTETSANIRIKDLRTFCNYCAGRDWLKKNPYDQITIIEPEGMERFLTRSEAARLLRAARLERFVPGGGRPIQPLVEEAIIRAGLESPNAGKKMIASILNERGIKAWPATIQRVWRRHGMASPEERSVLARAGQIPLRQVHLITNKKASNFIRRVLHFGLYTGMREREVRAARREKIAHREIRDPKSGAVIHQYLLEVKGKGRNKKRVIPLAPSVVRINGIDKMVGQIGPLFEELTKSKLAQARRRAVKRAGLGRVRYHDLRHSFARNYLLSRAGGTPQAKKMMGHSRLQSLEKYAHFDVEDIADTIGMVRPR